MKVITMLTACLVASTTVFVVGCGGNGRNGRIRASGTVECTEVNVAAKIPGIIQTVTPQEGDRIDSGTVVAGIDHSDLDWQLAQAQAGLDAAQANFQLALNGARVEDVNQAEAAVRQAQVQVSAGRTDLERIRQLASEGTVTQKQLDDAETRVQTATAALEIAQASHARLVAGTRTEQIAARRAAVRQAEARISSIEQRIQDCTVRAPLSGTVTHRLSEPGEMAAMGTGLVTISALNRAWLKVYLNEVDIGRIQLGQQVNVFLDAAPEQARHGVVTFISPTAEFTPKNVQTPEDRVKLVFGVKVTLDNADGAFKPGLPADAVFNDTAHAVAGGNQE